MPLSKKGSKILGNMQSEYGDKKGESVFYASINAGKVTGAEKGKRGGGAVASALRVARKLATGGLPEGLPPAQGMPGMSPQGSPGIGPTFQGPIVTGVAGRTDRHKMDVAPGSYVVPADVVSHLGENNTLAGQRVLDHMFPAPPQGWKPPNQVKVKKPHKPSAMKPHKPHADGGDSGDGGGGEPVKIIAAGGEYVIPPENIAFKFGDLDHGHQSLDQFVLATRKKHIQKLQSLPAPKK